MFVVETQSSNFSVQQSLYNEIVRELGAHQPFERLVYFIRTYSRYEFELIEPSHPSLANEDVVWFIDYEVPEFFHRMMFIKENLLRQRPRRIIGVLPLFPFGRSDKAGADRVSACEMILQHLTQGLDHLITVNFHNPAMLAQHARSSYTNLLESEEVAAALEKFQSGIHIDTVLAADKGAFAFAQQIAKVLGNPKVVACSQMRVDGQKVLRELVLDPRTETVLLVDDITRSGQTLKNILEMHKQTMFVVYVTHSYHTSTLEQLEMFTNCLAFLTSNILATEGHVNVAPLIVSEICQYLSLSQPSDD